MARKPGNGFICSGCWIYRCQRVTLQFLTEGFRDGQTAASHSWWLSGEGFYALRKEDHTKLYEHLLKPPNRFALSFRSAAVPRNELHCSILNDHAVLRADTELFFTFDNVPFIYSIHELEMAIKQGGNGRLPGVQLLLRHLGKSLQPDPQFNKLPQRGRPPNLDEGKGNRRLVTSSGIAILKSK